MPKINKDFSDALGFRLLSSYQSFVNEYPVEGAKIQKLYDDGFRETCIKCYPVIVGTGVDPTLYEPKIKPGNDLKNELRNMFPIKKAAAAEMVEEEPFKRTSETIDLTEESYKPVVALPVVKKPSPKREPVSPPKREPVSPPKREPASPPKREPVSLPKREPVSPPKNELVSLPPIRPQQKCANCEKLRQQVLDLEVANNKVLHLEVANNKVVKLNKEQTEVIVHLKAHIKKLQSYLSENNDMIGKHQQTISDLQIAKNMNLRTISALEKENARLVGLVRQCHSTVKDLDLQIEASKKRKQ